MLLLDRVFGIVVIVKMHVEPVWSGTSGVLGGRRVRDALRGARGRVHQCHFLTGSGDNYADWFDVLNILLKHSQYRLYEASFIIYLCSRDLVKQS